MGRVIVRHLDEPDEVSNIELMRSQIVDLGDLKVSRNVTHPGWRWSTHVKQLVGTRSCQVRHIGLSLSGRFQVQLEDGEQATIGPGDVFSIPPGHDAWVVGNEPWVSVDWAGIDEWLRPADSTRVLASLLMTDIVESTGHLRRLGDRGWRELLATHDERLRAITQRAEGREIKSTGDGFLFLFDGAVRALRAAAWMAEAASVLGLQIRAAVHAGEVELVGGDVRGIAVHEVARILSVAEPDEVLASDVTRLLAAGGGLRFTDRGRHRLKGFDEEVHLFALQELG